MYGIAIKSIDLKGLKHLQRKSPEAFRKAQEIGAIQLLTWMNTGAGGTSNSRKPPIRFGVLRGSSSAFVGKKLVAVHKQEIKQGADEKPTPAESCTADDTVITVVWNTDYAAKMHEYTGEGGFYTKQDGNAGGNWITEHIKSDRQLLMDMIGREFKKAVKL